MRDYNQQGLMIMAGAEGEQYCHHKKYYNVLTYEDQDGDWMMVGDVPWE